MRSPKALLLGASIKTRILLDDHRFAEARQLVRCRSWMTFSDPSAYEPVPEYVAEALNGLYDEIVQALEHIPPDTLEARRVCDRVTDIIDAMR